MASLLTPLARASPLSLAELRMLVATQFRALYDRFPRAPTEELRNLPCLWDSDHVQGRALFRDGPIVDGPAGLDLTTHGLFYKQPEDKVAYKGQPQDPVYHVSCDGTLVLYGLTDRGQWMVAHVDFHYDPGTKGHGRSIADRAILRYEHPTQVAEKAGLPEDQLLCHVWRDLAQRTKKALDAAQEEAQIALTDLGDRSHELRLFSCWMATHHSDQLR